MGSPGGGETVEVMVKNALKVCCSRIMGMRTNAHAILGVARVPSFRHCERYSRRFPLLSSPHPRLTGIWLRHVFRAQDRRVKTNVCFRAANEEHVGKAIRESGIPREEIFVTTKLP